MSEFVLGAILGGGIGGWAALLYTVWRIPRILAGMSAGQLSALADKVSEVRRGTVRVGHPIDASTGSSPGE